ncbi:MAG: HAMP domain-containing histidine kinase [Saprospiraceae bacterium]|nr:HAMP domain-containing histidine kinase [Saprospiraceae bacterium]
MNQKAIWVIIGLMSLAVIGVLSLQMSFINNSRRLNEEQFDKHISASMRTVAKRLENVENIQVTNFANGFSIKHLEVDTSNGSFRYQQRTMMSNDPSVLRQTMDAVQLKQEMFNTPIEERIDVVQLDHFLKEELGSDIPFSYGVWSNGDNCFVIFNNQYIVPTQNQVDYRYLKSSEYKTNLFPTDINNPGTLHVFFPTKSAVVWGRLWLDLLMSLLFAAIILGSFAYTINVILQQKKLSEMKNDFINNMTHEFKTPIATISLASDSITNPSVINNPDKVKRFADIIRQENKRMHGQVEKVLQMALVERGKIKLNFTEVNLHQVIEQAVGNMSLQVERKDGTVAAELRADKHYIEGDLNHISNVINNLLDNANKYSPEKPEIIVSTRNVANGIEVTVSDKGIGMSKEAKKRIFEKFYRVHTGNLHDVKGFGLGLAYVKAMVTAHKGSIDVKSELGKGSSFILLFPFKVGQDSVEHEEEG